MACPLCHQPSFWKDNLWRPFCSERCQVADLSAWATNRYRIPGPTLAMDTSRSGSLEMDDDIETPQND